MQFEVYFDYLYRFYFKVVSWNVFSVLLLSNQTKWPLITTKSMVESKENIGQFIYHLDSDTRKIRKIEKLRLKIIYVCMCVCIYVCVCSHCNDIDLARNENVVKKSVSLFIWYPEIFLKMINQTFIYFEYSLLRNPISSNIHTHTHAKKNQLEEINQKVLVKEERIKRYRQRVKQYKTEDSKKNERKFYHQVGRDDTKTYNNRMQEKLVNSGVKYGNRENRAKTPNA